MGASDVCLDERIRSVNRSIHVRLGSEVNDGVDSLALDDVAHGVAIANITLQECEPLVLCQRLEARQVTGVRERIQADHLVIGMMLRPELDEVAADETGGSRYKHPTHRR